MDRCDSQASDTCWFCKKGRHDDCMKAIPTGAASEGPHDCSFDTRMTACKCRHCRS